MKYDALFTRAASNALATDSKERALSVYALRRFWHAVFDPCPELSRRWGDKNREFLDPFLERAARDRLSMRWTLHAHLLLWMREDRPDDVTPALAQELMAASAARWANDDQSDAKGALLYFAGLESRAVAAWKMKSPEEDSRVVLVRLESPPASPAFCVAFCPQFRYPDAPDWRPLPL